MKPIRLIVVALVVGLFSVGVSQTALAQFATCSTTQVRPGQVITVTGGDVDPATPVNLFFNGTLIGASTSDASGFFTVSGPIPAGATPGTYEIVVGAVVGGGAADIPACFVTVLQAVPDPTPTPTTAPAAAVPTPRVVFVPVGGPIFQQQQQQQGGGLGPAAPLDPRRPGQQQFIPAPRFVPTGGVSLPKTGVEATRMALWGSALLAFGLVLVLIARRRRRAARRRALAELPPIEAVVVEPEQPWLPGTPHPSEFLTEADGLPPVYEPEAKQLYLPAPAEADDDILTPSF